MISIITNSSKKGSACLFGRNLVFGAYSQLSLHLTKKFGAAEFGVDKLIEILRPNAIENKSICTQVQM